MQGGPLSPLLANIYLDELDKELEKRGHRFARYADDLICICKSRRAAERTLASLTRFVQDKMLLKVNQEKSHVSPVTSPRTKFLGYGFYFSRAKGEVRLTIHKKSKQKLKDTIRQLLTRNPRTSIENVKQLLAQKLRGWMNYFQLADAQKWTQEVDRWIRRRIRQLLWKTWKKVKTRIKALIKLGADPVRAYYWGCTRKGAVSGSGPATVAALGLILIPAMVKNGYDKAFAAANVSVTSGLAIVIPPSIAFIVYGGIADASVPALFAAGILPGLLVAGFLMLTVYLISKKRGYRGLPRQESTWLVFKDAIWGVMTPVIILGGIYGGIFTPTEAAAVAIFYGLFVGTFIYKTFNSWDKLLHVLFESVKATAVIMFVVTCAGLFAWVASTVGLVERGAAVLLALSDNPWALLFLINVILLAAGMIMDAISIYYVLLPFLLPIVHHFAWDPVWFGVMMTVNLAVGQVTPPVAVNLYVGAQIADLTMEEMTPPVIPLLLATLVALAVIVLFPGLSTFLPTLWGL